MKKREMNFDDLASMIKKGFDHVDERFDKVEKDIRDLKAGQIKLEIGQKEIKHDLNFAVRKFELKELEGRIEKLEYEISKVAK
jgi:polyhydroxyalkanoate synthesis regulator phasin